MLNKISKILTVSMFLLISNCLFSQSVVFGNIVKEDSTSIVEGKLIIYKQLNDSTYIIREKKFVNQSMVSLDPGEYIFSYHFSEKNFVEKISIKDNESVIVLNILENPMRLSDFDLSNAIFLTIGMADLALLNRQTIYIEF